MILHWKRFTSLLSLRKAFRSKPCIYLQTDPEETILRIGESKDMYERYRGGTAYALEAALHKSGNLFFVAEAPAEENQRKQLEATMIYDHQPKYCNEHKSRSPQRPVQYDHEGDVAKGLCLHDSA